MVIRIVDFIIGFVFKRMITTYIIEYHNLSLLFSLKI